jgi:TonB-dependent SusC/RagA subfamily outer membrane receptor
MAYLTAGTVLSMGGAVSEPMYVVVDGSPFTGGIDNINPNSVETVEVLKGPNASIYGMQGGAGVMVITTRQNDSNSFESNNRSALGSLQFTPKGFYKAREFYSPKYENTTIFWSPELITNKDGNASFEYYNADGHGTYRLVIEGIDNAGNVGRQVYRYKVE